MYAEETWINETEDCKVGNSGLYETFTDNIKRLFTAYQSQFGRCLGRMYETIKGVDTAIGWVFEKREQYTDCKEYYTQQTWVTLHNSKPVTTVKCDYKVLMP
jgi:hypothetical protein